PHSWVTLVLRIPHAFRCRKPLTRETIGDIPEHYRRWCKLQHQNSGAANSINDPGPTDFAEMKNCRHPQYADYRQDVNVITGILIIPQRTYNDPSPQRQHRFASP